ncbi:hypothetical protein [Chryseobacterium foetidum]|uniref:hypothetical protein n=1 Tax=Chryseobacterium foetidum TaxID=2951057 RepID=UPI0021C61EFB|nr:hypothetical protein [Chryseobacterium foetidum]
MKNKTAGLISIAFLIWSGSVAVRNLEKPESLTFLAAILGCLFFSLLLILNYTKTQKK